MGTVTNYKLTISFKYSTLINLKRPKDKKVYFVGPMNYSETFDEEIDDFDWRNKETTGAKTIKKFVKEKITPTKVIKNGIQHRGNCKSFLDLLA